MRFDWDFRKAASNLVKHGVSFEEATTAFDDPVNVVKFDAKHSVAYEQRNWLLGSTDSGRVVVVVFTEREFGLRIISARPANRKERMFYETFRRIPL